jgi:putative solute:sodium symporter small subunit
MQTTNDQAYWGKTRALTFVVLFLWAVFSFFIHMFAPQLNETKIFGFPLGFYFAAQGSLIAFVLLLFWFARAQNKIDQEFGVAEDL